MAGAAAVVVAFAVAAVLLITEQPSPTQHGSFVNSLQRGEFRSVPNACTSVSAGALSQYLPGTPRKATQSIASSTQSQCTFTVDVKPVFRVLEVTSQAYLPSGLATGNGSATNNAIDNYLATQQGLANPAKKTRMPKARISQLTGLGNAAFSALQHFRVGGEPTDIVTMLVRDHNAVITIRMQASFDRHGVGGSQPVPVSQLRADALAVTRQVLAKVAAGPTVSS